MNIRKLPLDDFKVVVSDCCDYFPRSKGLENRELNRPVNIDFSAIKREDDVDLVKALREFIKTIEKM